MENYPIKRGFCFCGCGQKTKLATSNRPDYGYAKGEPLFFLRGHAIRVRERKPVSQETRDKMSAARQKYPTLTEDHKKKIQEGHRRRCDRTFSPYLPDTVVRFKGKRWICAEHGNQHHAKRVYIHYYGGIPEGYVVHHKNGDPTELSSDAPDNLMLLTNDWNFRFFPTLSDGFDLHESILTEIYCSIEDKDSMTDSELFTIFCYRASVYKMKIKDEQCLLR